METLELPVMEEQDEAPPVNFAEVEIDLAAFRLWQDASRLDSTAEDDKI